MQIKKRLIVGNRIKSNLSYQKSPPGQDAIKQPDFPVDSQPSTPPQP